jgi:sec-independent protein translocase protein TatC
VNRRNDENDVESFAMPLGEHLEELRVRVVRCILVLVVLFIVAWAVRDYIMQALLVPHLRAARAAQIDATLKFSSYLEPIMAQLKACLLAALVAASPYVLYQAWGFIAPGLYRRERKFMARVGAASVLCFATGAAFGYFLFIPLALRFLLAMAGPQVEPVLMIGPYLSMLLVVTLVLGLVFQTPLLLYHLVRWRIVAAEDLQRHRRAAILAAFIIGAVFTPPDPFTQIMMAVPLVMLYDIGIVLASPTRQTVGNSLKFIGLVAGLGGALAAAFFLWPIGQIELVLAAPVGGSGLALHEKVAVRRGQEVAIGEGALARLNLGRGSSRCTVLIRGDARLRVTGARTIMLERGSVFADADREGSPLEILTAPACVVLEKARAELLAPDQHVVTVNVVSGEALVRANGRSERVLAGRSETFSHGGQPQGPQSQIEQRWKQMLDAAAQQRD